MVNTYRNDTLDRVEGTSPDPSEGGECIWKTTNFSNVTNGGRRGRRCRRRGGGDWLFDKGEGTLFERLRISLIAPMVDRYWTDILEGMEGTDYLTRRRGLYMKNYEFLECHEWWTEMETVQAKGWRGLIIWQGGGDYIWKTTNVTNCTNGGQRLRRCNLKRGEGPFFLSLSREL